VQVQVQVEDDVFKSACRRKRSYRRNPLCRMHLRRCCAAVFSLTLLFCCISSALLDIEREGIAVISGARSSPIILSPAPGSAVASDANLHVRIVVPALARAVCTNAHSLSLSLDDAAIASQRLPPQGAEPFHVAFALDVASMQLRHGSHELLAQLVDSEGAVLGVPSVVDFDVQDGVSPQPTVPATPISHAKEDAGSLCSARASSTWTCSDDLSCNSAGSCVRGVCHCRPGWFGATCSVQPDDSSEYLPAVDPLRDAAVLCAESMRHARLASRLRQMIGGWRERPFDCGCFEGVVDAGSCPVVGSVPLYGIGAQIRHATRLLHTAVSEARPLVLVPERGVDGRMVSFAPCMPLPQWIADAAPALTHVDFGHAFNGWKSEANTQNNATAHGFPQQVVCVILATHSCSPQLRLRAARQIGRLLPDSETWRYLAPEFSPPPPDFSDFGSLAFRSELTAALLTPLPWFDALLTSHAAMLGLVAPSLGVHLRRGDACFHSEWDPAFRPLCVELAVYVDSAIVMLQRYHPASVFVSSDDSAAAATFEAALRAAGVEVPIVTARVGDLYQGRSLLEDRVGWDNVEPADVAWTTLRDIFLLARSEFFVVNFASQLSRVAFELAFSRRSGLLPPYISVDGFPWCDAPCKFGRDRQRAVSDIILNHTGNSVSRC
jgi:hypothetical protein